MEHYSESSKLDSEYYSEFREWIRRDEAGRSTADKTQLEIPEVSVDTILKVRAFVKNWRAKGLIANKGNDETDESSTSSLQLVRKIQTPLTQVFVSRDPKACARAARDAMTMENVVSSHATLTDDCNSTHRSRYSGYATRCRHLTLDDNDDSNGFFHPTTQKWHATFSVRTVRVGSFDTPTHVKFVVCEQCHDAVQRRKLCSVVFCVGCCLNVPVSATEENDSGRLCVCCAALVRKKKKRDTTARRLECTPGNIEYDRAIAEYNTQSTKSSVGFMDAADVPNLDTILFKSTGANGNVFKWDPLRREAHSSENEVRWRVGGHTAQNVQREGIIRTPMGQTQLLHARDVPLASPARLRVQRAWTSVRPARLESTPLPQASPPVPSALPASTTPTLQATPRFTPLAKPAFPGSLTTMTATTF